MNNDPTKYQTNPNVQPNTAMARLSKQQNPPPAEPAKAKPLIYAPESQIAPTQQPIQPTEQTDNTPSPNELPTTLGVDELNKLKSTFDPSTGQLPDTLNVGDISKVLQMTQSGPGYSGKATVGDIPQGYSTDKNFEGFIGGQCTSYASWYWENVLGKTFKNTRPGQGNAKNWAGLAKDQGYSVSSIPQIGDIVVFPSTGQFGHVAIVHGVNEDGSINISEMNYKPGQYTVRDNVSTQGAQFIK
jgi:surface antigen